MCLPSLGAIVAMHQEKRWCGTNVWFMILIAETNKFLLVEVAFHAGEPVNIPKWWPNSNDQGQLSGQGRGPVGSNCIKLKTGLKAACLPEKVSHVSWGSELWLSSLSSKCPTHIHTVDHHLTIYILHAFIVHRPANTEVMQCLSYYAWRPLRMDISWERNLA